MATTNPGGVLVVNGSAVILNNFTFQGTLVVNGSLYIDGTNINFSALSGFPALVVIGQIFIVDYSTFTCNGLVSSMSGLRVYSGPASHSTGTITGGYVSSAVAYDPTLGGTHQLICNAAACKLYDTSGATSDATTAKIQITQWSE